MSDDLLLH